MNKRIPILIGILLVFIAAWLLVTPNNFIHGLVDRLNNLGYDLQLRAKILTHPVTPSAPVAIVDIDDRSLKIEGRWPWPRSKMAKLVDELNNHGAAVIAFDIFFSESEENIASKFITELSSRRHLTAAMAKQLNQYTPLFDEDSQLAESLKKTHTVLALGFLPRKQTANLLPPPLITLNEQEQEELEVVRAGGFISNIPILQNAAKGSGFINIFADSDGIIRHAVLLMKYKDGLYPALALQAVLTFLDSKISLITPTYNKAKKLEGIRMLGRVIPTDEKGQVLIPFIGRSYTFPYYSATDILHHAIPKNALRDKILFVGTSATGLGDLQATSIQSPFPGVEIQATLVNGMLLGDFSYIPPWILGANIVITLIFGLLAAFTFPYFGPRMLSSLIVLLPPTLLLFNNWIWDETGLVLSLLMPLVLILVIALVNIVYGYLFETRKRERLKEMFGQYVPEKHIDEMLKAQSNYALRGDDRDMSVLFADIRSFTTISEGMSAKDLVEMLNTFFTPMTEIIFKHHGTIDKYVGDMIMAFWGAPLKDKHHARHAIESALEMQEKVKLIQPVLAEKQWPEIKIGIGINSGIMSVGDMGSRFRRNYTVLGDSVNLASRVESLTKFYGVSIIVTESSQRDQSRFVFRQLDLVRVKGKKDGVGIYEVVCFIKNLTPEISQELALYQKALDAYFAQQWDAAEVLMNQLHQTHPDKKIYVLYLERIHEFKQHPLPPEWDGVYVHITK